MPHDDHDAVRIRKQELRHRMRERRRAFALRHAASSLIHIRLLRLPELIRARTVMTYVSVGTEVATRDLISQLISLEKAIIVPYCQGIDLRLFRLRTLEELVPGTLGIPEPPPELRENPQRQARAEEIDLVLIPGLAFDRRGNRLGQGKGYYDRFLLSLRPTAFKLGLAFECQMVEDLPRTPRDTPVDAVLTEKMLYRFHPPQNGD
ncbi:5-formyltetrahydrofolate cyclo-ligase [Thermopirellula anaerolimosa]